MNLSCRVQYSASLPVWRTEGSPPGPPPLRMCRDEFPRANRLTPEYVAYVGAAVVPPVFHLNAVIVLYCLHTHTHTARCMRSRGGPGGIFQSATLVS